MTEATAAAAPSAETPAAAAAALPIKVEMNSDTEAKLERARCTALSQLGERYSIESGTVRQWIDSGASLDRAGADVITVMEKRSKESTQSVAKLGLSRAEARNTASARAVLRVPPKAGAVRSSRPNARLPRRRSWAACRIRVVFVPLDIQERAIDPRAVRGNMADYSMLQRDMTVASASAGVTRSPPTTSASSSCYAIARCKPWARGACPTGQRHDSETDCAATAIWLANEASTITESTPVLSQLPLCPRRSAPIPRSAVSWILQSNQRRVDGHGRPGGAGRLMVDLAA
jgi:hypothetical protein